jgi:hypothetical protein
MTMNARILLPAILAFGCSAAPSELDQWCAAHRCNLTPLAIAPVQGGANVTPAAIRRLRDATGLGFIEDAYGVPVRFVDVLSDPDSDGACGTTTIGYANGEPVSAEIEIVFPAPAGCRPAWATLLHEAIHAFAPRAAHTETGGVFDLKSSSSVAIDDAARALLCDGRLGECVR